VCSSDLTFGGDNVGFVSANRRSPKTVIENNVIIGPGSGVHANTNGIIALRAIELTIRNNEISNVPIGIYFKHANEQRDDNNEIAYNYIHDTSRDPLFINGNYVRVHDNLLGKNNEDMGINEANGVPGGDYNNIYHNTLVCGIGLSRDSGGATYNVFKNNIIMKTMNIHPYSSTTHNSTMDYNLYSSGTAVREFDKDYSLSDWKSHYGEDANSISGSPTFVGGSSPNTIEGFALASGSIGKNAASGGKDIGADISKVGPQNFPKGDGIAPLPVMNVKISK